MRLPVFDRRRAGVLLHLGSLDAALGRGGRAFIDWLAQSGFSLWQILPVGPTGADGSLVTQGTTVFATLSYRLWAPDAPVKTSMYYK